MSRCLPHIPPIRHGLQGPTKQGHQRELGTPSLALGDAVPKKKLELATQEFCNWVVPAGTEQGAILACLFEFEWHCGGITQPCRQHVMLGHRWHIVHAAGQMVPLVARHWEQEVQLPSFRMPELYVQVPLVVLAPSTKAQGQAWNVPLKTDFPCPPKYGAGYLGADGRYVPQREDRLHKPFCNLSFSGVGGTLLKNKLLMGGC